MSTSPARRRAPSVRAVGAASLLAAIAAIAGCGGEPPADAATPRRRPPPSATPRRSPPRA